MEYFDWDSCQNSCQNILEFDCEWDGQNIRGVFFESGHGAAAQWVLEPFYI